MPPTDRARRQVEASIRVKAQAIFPAGIDAINRMVDAFPVEQQEQIRAQLSTALLAVISQALLPKAEGETGPEVAFAGRIVRYNLKGKLAFVHLKDHAVRLSATEQRIAQKVAPRLAAAGARVHAHAFLPLPGTPWAGAAPSRVDPASRLLLDRPLRALGDVIEDFTVQGRHGGGRAHHDQHLVLARADRDLLQRAGRQDIALLELLAGAAGQCGRHQRSRSDGVGNRRASSSPPTRTGAPTTGRRRT